MYTKSALLSALLGASAVTAHMEMEFPAPFKSKYNPHAGSDVDYSMTSPLAASGSDYPCKGYQSVIGTAAGTATASFAVGSKANATITGGANHDGGSCQLSLSYDSAKTFTVIQSIVGGCPAAGTSNLDFTIPSDAPTGAAVLAWSWHNEVGNREMYMNCAAVTLTGGSSKVKRQHHHHHLHNETHVDHQTHNETHIDHEAHNKTHIDHHHHNKTRIAERDTAFSSRPKIFVANVGAAGGGCVVPEGKPVMYPFPGSDLLATTTDTEAPVGNCDGTNTGSASTGAASSAAAAPSSTMAVSTSAAVATSSTTLPATTEPATTLATVTTAASSSSGNVFVTVSTQPAASASASTVASSSAAATTTAPPVVVIPSSTSAAAPAATSSASSSTGSSSGTFAAGTACSDEGDWNCIGGTSFQRCASGQWSVVMAMAVGTKCSAGVSSDLGMTAGRRRMKRGKSPMVKGRSACQA